MKTIVIANQKGGSGKSTSTVHLAVAAEQAGELVQRICRGPLFSGFSWARWVKSEGIQRTRAVVAPRRVVFQRSLRCAIERDAGQMTAAGDELDVHLKDDTGLTLDECLRSSAR